MSRRLETQGSAVAHAAVSRRRASGLIQAAAVGSCSTALVDTVSSCFRTRSALDLGPFEARMSNRVGEGRLESPVKSGEWTRNVERMTVNG